MRRRFSRKRDGTFKVSVGEDERALLAALPDQLETMLNAPGPEAQRLFPPAYAANKAFDGFEEEYQRLMREELVRRRIERLQTMRDSLEASTLTAEQLDAWVRALNDARLVLGTLLDVSEDTDPLDVAPDAPDTHQRVVYVILSAIVSDAVDALSGTV